MQDVFSPGFATIDGFSENLRAMAQTLSHRWYGCPSCEVESEVGSFSLWHILCVPEDKQGFNHPVINLSTLQHNHVISSALLLLS